MTETPNSSMSMVEARSESYPNAKSLARRVAFPVFEPTWWPDDVAPIEYSLDRFPDTSRYRIGSVRPGGVPILCVGGPANPAARLPQQDLEWREISQLTDWRGLITPSNTGFRAVLETDEHRLQLIGYVSEPELTTAIRSLRRVAGIDS
jgi:hypothetical protein